jgi:hypothetical protein
VYRYVPPREANWLLIRQSRVQRKRGLFDQSHAALKTLHDNCSTFSPNKQLDPQMLHAQIKEHVRLAMVTGHTQQALTLLSSSGNLDSLSKVNRADLYRLKGEVLLQTDPPQFREAQHQFSQSASLYPSLSKTWASWMRLNESQYDRTGSGTGGEEARGESESERGVVNERPR